MPLWKCTKCHHEWEGDENRDNCDWCKSEGKILESETPLELMVKSFDKDFPENKIE